jgi:hypothetical protein
VRGPVEVCALDDLGDVGDRVLGQHHGPEHALLGREILRWRPVEPHLGVALLRALRAPELRNAHCPRPPEITTDSHQLIVADPNHNGVIRHRQFAVTTMTPRWGPAPGMPVRRRYAHRAATGKPRIHNPCG